MSEIAKVNFLEQIHNFVRTKGADLQQNMAKAMQGHVSAIKPNDFIEFTIDATGPWTLPKLIIPQAFSKYHREPTQVGDKGYAIPGDFFIGGESGQDGSTANMYPRGNLSTLTFHPISNKNWPTKDPDMFLVTAGKKGHTTQSEDGKTSRVIDDQNNINDNSSNAVTSKSAKTNTVSSGTQDVNIVPSPSGKVTIGSASDPNQFPPIPSANTLMNMLGNITASGNIIAGGAMGAAGGFTGAGGGTNAPAGGVGEVISANVTTGIAMTTGVPINITSISLSPGDWNIHGEVWITGPTTASAYVMAINLVSATLPTAPGVNVARFQVAGTLTSSNILATKTVRANLTTQTTYFLVAQCNYTAGAALGSGTIWARRMR